MNQQFLALFQPTVDQLADATPTLPGIPAILQHDTYLPSVFTSGNQVTPWLQPAATVSAIHPVFGLIAPEHDKQANQNDQAEEHSGPARNTQTQKTPDHGCTVSGAFEGGLQHFKPGQDFEHVIH